MSENDFDAIFDGENQTVEVPEPQATVQEEPQEEIQSDEDTGVSEPAEEATTSVEAAEDTDTEEEKSPHQVPLPTFLDMRDKMKEQKAEAEALRKQLEKYQRTQQQKPQAPNPQDDPLGYADHRFAELERQRINDRILVSGQFALRTHGQEAVSEAAAWAEARAKADPAFDAQVAGHADPIEWVIQQHKTAKQLEDFQRDPEAYARRIAEEKGWLAPPQASAPVATSTTLARKIPTSLTDVPAANTATKATEGDDTADFNAIFDRKR